MSLDVAQSSSSARKAKTKSEHESKGKERKRVSSPSTGESRNRSNSIDQLAINTSHKTRTASTDGLGMIAIAKKALQSSIKDISKELGEKSKKPSKTKFNISEEHLLALQSKPIPSAADVDEIFEVLFYSSQIDAKFLQELTVAYRYFTTARELLLKLITRYKSAPAVGRYAPEQVQGDWKTASSDNVHYRILEFIERWIVNFFYDFEEDDVLFRSLLSFIDTSLSNAEVSANRLRLAIQEQARDVVPQVLVPNASTKVFLSALKKPSSGLLEMRTVEQDTVDSMIGRDMVDFLLYNSAFTSKADAIQMCDQLYRAGLILSASSSLKEFRSDAQSMYILAEKSSEPSEDDAPEPLLPHDIDQSLSTFLNFSPLEVARQLTIIAHSLFRGLQPYDLKLQLWDTSPEEINRVELLEQISEKTINWVASEIVLTRDFASRVKMLKRFIKLAVQLHELRNFNSCFAVVAGLSVKAVNRLRNTWKALPPKSVQRFEALTELTDPSNGYNNYRTAFRGTPRPAMPNVNLLLNEVKSIEQGTNDHLDDEHTEVNLKKLRNYSTLFLSQVHYYQRQSYNFKALPLLQDYLSKVVIIPNNEDLLKMSMQCEPSSLTQSGENLQQIK